MTRSTERIGASTMTGDDNVGLHMKRLARASAIAGTRGAERAKSELQKVFRTRGSPQGWAPNSPATIENKGSSDPLMETGVLFEGIEVRPVSIGAAETSAKVGWFDTPHPSSPGLTLAGLAALHDGLSAIGGGYFEGGGGVLVPHRPQISQVAYSPVVNKSILDDMEIGFTRAYGGGYGPSGRGRRPEPSVAVPEGFFG